MDARSACAPAVRLAGFDVRAAIIDLDGTLVDTLGDFHAALGGMLAELGLPDIAREQVETRIGKGSEYLVQQTLRLHLDDAAVEARFPEAIATYQRHYGRINGRFSDPFPGVPEGLAALRAAGLTLACITNKPTAYARELLEIKRLRDFFVAVNGGDAFARKKPDPMPLVETCRQIGLPPAQVLMIGDSQNDALAARAAGCPVALVTYGYNHGEPVRAVDADGFADRIGDLLAA